MRAAADPPTWAQKILQQKWQTKLWDDSKQILRMGRQARSVERLVRKAQDGTLGKSGKASDEDEPTEIVNFGEMRIARGGGMSTLAKVAIGAAIASGLMGPVAGFVAARYLTQSVSGAATDRDTDTIIEVGQ